MGRYSNDIQMICGCIMTTARRFHQKVPSEEELIREWHSLCHELMTSTEEEVVDSQEKTVKQ